MMTPELFQRAKAIFFEACDLDPSDRAEFLQEKCGDDRELLSAVEKLLRSDDEPLELESDGAVRARLDELLQPGPESSEMSITLPERIGDFRIIRKIGEGGMGAVYEAEQISLQRHVALKMVRSEFGGRSLIRRFQREIALLSKLDHPGIARIFQTGTTEISGRPCPYFVMELVHGQILSAYLNSHSPSATDRITLFAEICDAVHFAHLRGIIHRDLKPGNIMVTESGRPVILDFGVARATDSDMFATTVTMAVGQIVGTLSYMSPEQAGGAADQIDARSDVYSLGVILYEMLSGNLPHDLEGKSIADAAITIRDGVPTRLSRIDRNLRGDLETIVQKTLRKEPSLRYDSAAALSQDLRRFLADEPIIARPPSTIYELSKFAKRNRALVLTVMLASVALVFLSIFATSKAVLATKAQRVAEKEAHRATAAVTFLTDVLASTDPNVTEGKAVSVLEVLDEASDRIERGDVSENPEIEAQIHTTIGRSYLALGEIAKGQDHLESALELNQLAFGQDDLISCDSMDYLAYAYTALGKFDEAEALYEQSRDLRLKRFGPNAPMGPIWPNSLANVYQITGRFDEAEAELRKAITRIEREGDRKKLAKALSGLGMTLEAQAEYPEAIAAHKRSIDINRELYGELNTEFASGLNNLGATFEANGEYEKARDILRQALEIRERILKPDHPDIATTCSNLGLVLLRLGQAAESESMTRKAIAIRDVQLPPLHPTRAASLNNLAKAIQAQGRAEEAMKYFDQAIDIAEKSLPTDHLMTVFLKANRARCRGVMGDSERAEADLKESYEKLASSVGADHRRTRNVAEYLVELYQSLDRKDDVETWSKRVADQNHQSNK